MLRCDNNPTLDMNKCEDRCEEFVADGDIRDLAFINCSTRASDCFDLGGCTE